MESRGGHFNKVWTSMTNIEGRAKVYLKRRCELRNFNWDDSPTMLALGPSTIVKVFWANHITCLSSGGSSLLLSGLSCTFVFQFFFEGLRNFLPRVSLLSSPTFVSQSLRFFVSQCFDFLWSIWHFLSNALRKVSPTIVYICLPISLGMFPKLLLHCSLSFCNSLVPLVLVLEEVSGWFYGFICGIMTCVLLWNGKFTKKPIHPSPLCRKR